MIAVNRKTNTSTLLEKKKKLSIDKWLKTTMHIFPFLLIALSVYLFQWFAVYAILIYSVLFAGYKIYINRESFMIGIRTIETYIWGKPAEDLKPGERRPKLVFVWNKRDLYARQKRDRKTGKTKSRAKDRSN